MADKNIITSVLNEIDSEKQEIENIIKEAIPPYCAELCNKARHDLKDAKNGEFSVEGCEEAQKYWAGFLLNCDVVIPLALIWEHHKFKNCDKELKEFLFEATEDSCQTATPAESFDLLRTLPKEERNMILSVTDNFVALTLALEEGNKELFIQYCSEIKTGAHRFFSCCCIYSKRKKLASVCKAVDDSLSEEILNKIKNNYINPTIGELLGSDYVKDIEKANRVGENYPLKTAQEFLEFILLELLSDDFNMSDIENELFLKYLYTDYDLIYDDYVEPIYFKCIIKVDGSLDRYIKEWTESAGENCKAVQHARAYIAKQQAKAVLPEPTKKSSAGRKKGNWLKCEYSEDTLKLWSDRIQNKIWGNLIKRFGNFDLKSVTKTYSAKKCLAASILFYVAFVKGISKNYYENGVATSYEKTLKDAGIDVSRSSLEPYMKMMVQYSLIKKLARNNNFNARTNQYTEADSKEDDDELFGEISRAKEVYEHGHIADDEYDIRIYESKDKIRCDILLSNYGKIEAIVRDLKKILSE